MEFTVKEGQRKSSVTYVADGFVYVLVASRNEKIYLRCTLAKSNDCKAAAQNRRRMQFVDSYKAS